MLVGIFSLSFLSKIFKKKFVCPGAFSQVYIYPDGRVFLCPDCMMTKEAEIGDLNKQSFEEIWNSKTAMEIRKRILKGEYPFCKVPFCISRSNYNLRLIPTIGIKNKVRQDSYPKMVCIGADAECNVNCIMCRSTISRISNDDLPLFNKKIDEIYLPILKSADELTLSTTCDPFASRNTRLLMKSAAEMYPSLKFNLITNGILCNKANCDEIGITEKLSRVMVSIHAATEETYNKIVKNGNFSKVIENIEWLKEMKEKGLVKNLFFAFVVSSQNYKEIPLFIDFAEKYSARALFWGCISWGDNLLSCEGEPLDIIDPEHPRHYDFVNSLNVKKVKDHSSYFAVNIRRLIK